MEEPFVHTHFSYNDLDRLRDWIHTLATFAVLGLTIAILVVTLREKDSMVDAAHYLHQMETTLKILGGALLTPHNNTTK